MRMDTQEGINALNTLYSFLNVNQPLVESDILLVLGNEDKRTAQHAASVFLQGWAPSVLISGHHGMGTRGKITRTEAEVFADIMVSCGVPREKILLETRSTNTGENVRFSQQLLTENNIRPTSIIVATKSAMKLRAYLTFKKQWKSSTNVKLTVTCPDLRLEEYPNEDVGSFDDAVEYIVNTFEKLTTYAERGFQSTVDIPDSVKDAHRSIVYLRSIGAKF